MGQYDASERKENSGILGHTRDVQLLTAFCFNKRENYKVHKNNSVHSLMLRKRIPKIFYSKMHCLSESMELLKDNYCTCIFRLNNNLREHILPEYHRANVKLLEEIVLLQTELPLKTDERETSLKL